MAIIIVIWYFKLKTELIDHIINTAFWTNLDSHCTATVYENNNETELVYDAIVIRISKMC
ncbi:hypothetical protein QR98_0004760 [Sarcoptes scabiei]|uniref:Uncharacterized protein n=1 Tax=Sarcoptes scabiei TaxID=52283 RepID=A0A131ZVH8_SARSC|nr:hypothetical protein QR98_0004760 [Sarcoptes scabiei]